MLADGCDLGELPGIGENLTEKIATLVETGALPLLDEVEQRVPRQLAELTGIEGLGLKRVQQLYHRGWLSAGDVVNTHGLPRLTQEVTDHARIARRGNLRPLSR